MPITFKSKHAPNIVMLEQVGLELLHLAGHSGGVPGSFAVEDLPAALARLEGAVAEGPGRALTAERPARDDDADNERPREAPVSIAHRAGPLIDMLRTALAEGDYVIWDR
ncbi:MAG: DUF1840 domain-containing protein [Gammaproteobacteria bacterium]|nr:DUF1840 domain-containing protein [Gammaproteobacteria bacterium]